MELNNIMDGLLDTALLDTLKQVRERRKRMNSSSDIFVFQLSVSSLWPDDDTFLPTSALMNAHTYSCTSEEWLNHCGLDSEYTHHHSSHPLLPTLHRVWSQLLPVFFPRGIPPTT